MAKVFSSARSTAVRCDGSGYTACLCIGWRNWQKTRFLHLFVHPIKNGWVGKKRWQGDAAKGLRPLQGKHLT